MNYFPLLQLLNSPTLKVVGSSQILFIYLAVVLGLSSVLGYATKTLRLPLIVAYLLTGVLLSLFQLVDGQTSRVLQVFPDIGIAFVLFLVGMELDLSELRNLGRPIIFTTLIQIIISTAAGYFIATVFGIPIIEAAFLGIGLSFSSTIVVVKLLLEKKDLTSLYGKLSLGILLVEDAIALVILMGLTVGTSVFNLGLQSTVPFVAFAVKGILLWFCAVVASRYLLRPIFVAVAQSAELLFLSALAWCFVFISFSLSLGFSVVIGAFLAGVALANSPFHYEIQGKVKPLRDFFVALFFIFLGSQVSFSDFSRVIPVVLIFTLFTLIMKPLIFMPILGMFGFKKHTIFQTSISQSQISEFSLIIMVVGIGLGYVTQTSLTIMALTGVLSIIISSIIITYSRTLYGVIGNTVRIFERMALVERIDSKTSETAMEEHVILIGAHRLGGAIFQFFSKKKVPILVIDFNPKVIQALAKEGINALYGDVGDPEILDFLNLTKAKLIISTAQDKEDSLILLTQVKRKKVKAPVIVRAATVHDAKILYKAGADYVILPELVAADFIKHVLRSHWPKTDFFTRRPEIELSKLNRHIMAGE